MKISGIAKPANPRIIETSATNESLLIINVMIAAERFLLSVGKIFFLMISRKIRKRVAATITAMPSG